RDRPETSRHGAGGRGAPLTIVPQTSDIIRSRSMPMEPQPTRSSARPAINDRLGSTLFLAALVHGIVILGVTFTVATFDDDRAPPSLNVTLLVDGRDEPAPDKADFIANRNSQAVGVAAKGLHATTALSANEPLA